MNGQEKGNFFVRREYYCTSQMAEAFLSKHADEKSAIFPRGFC
jgi:hypothetical protein